MIPTSYSGKRSELIVFVFLMTTLNDRNSAFTFTWKNGIAVEGRISHYNVNTFERILKKVLSQRRSNCSSNLCGEVVQVIPSRVLMN